MNRISFVDTTLRDGIQSLWGVRMSTAMAYPIASSINQAGFKAVDFTGGTHFVFQIKTYRENPWERVRLLASKINKAPLSLMMLAYTISAFKPMQGPIIRLWLERCYANGLRRLQPMDDSNNMDRIAETVKYAKEAGLQVVIPLIYSHSPVHTDDYFARKARDIADLNPDAIYLKDPGGLLTPERVKTLIPSIQQNIGGLPLEMHSHCTTGLAPMCYLEAIKLGVRTLHTAIWPLAYGSGQPSVTNIIENLDMLGYESDLDLDAIQKVSDHLNHVARREGFPMGQIPEYNAAQYEHQIPGGVISNLRRQLAEIGLEHRLKEVINEVIRVRAELGYPIIVTPISQYVVTQATLNITLGERYQQVLDEIVKIVVGCYGPQAGTIDENLLDRVSNLPIAEQYKDWHIPRPSIKELREQYGSDVSDDELLLRVLCQDQKEIEAMHAAGPINTYYPPPQKPLVEFIEGLIKQKKHAYIYFESDDLGIKLGRQLSHGGDSGEK
jgi:oxaloacetate decarboxylase (Na+ extruding) subunit alpha